MVRIIDDLKLLRSSPASLRDTVGSVGVIPHSSLPFVQSNDAIRVFRHALALDERRVRFKPALYRHTAPEDVHGINPGDMPKGDTTWAFADKLEPLLAQLYGGKPHRSVCERGSVLQGPWGIARARKDRHVGSVVRWVPLR